MAKKTIPVYDICQISKESRQQDLLAERLGTYLEKHYKDLHRPHGHSFYHLVLFTKGRGSHSVDFVKFNVRPHEMYFMAPGQVHSWNFEGEMDGYVVHFNANLFSSFLQNSHYLDRFAFFSGSSEDAVCQLPVAIREPVIALFESLLKEFNENTSQALDLVRVRLLELFLLADRFCVSKKARKVPPQKYLLLRNFQQLIDKHFRTIKLPKEYAELLYVTPNHLNVLCQDVLGKTAGELIRERILLEAKRLLTNGDMTITELAYDLNFQDNSYFNRFFKKYALVTPEEFRKSFTDQ